MHSPPDGSGVELSVAPEVDMSLTGKVKYDRVEIK